jgi:hypothetical protein
MKGKQAAPEHPPVTDAPFRFTVWLIVQIPLVMQLPRSSFV